VTSEALVRPLGRSAGEELLPEVVRTLVNGAVHSSEPLLVVRSGRGPLSLEQAAVAWANRAAGEMLHCDSTSLVGRPLHRLLAPVAPGRFRPEVLRRERAASAQVTVQAADGTRADVVLRAVPSPATGLWVLSLKPVDTAVERAAQEAVAAHEQRFAALFERSPVATVLSDAGMRLGHVNDAFCALLGATADALLGTGWLERVHEDDLAGVVECVQLVLGGADAELPARILRPDGEQRWVHLRLAPASSPGQGALFVGTVEDVTERRAFEQRLSHQARHDALTGLPNRNHLIEVMTERLGRRSGRTSPMTCMFIDLDNFKLVNDSLGHDAGDRLLVTVAHRLTAAVGERDVVARWGGDEFVVLCDGLPDDSAALAMAEELVQQLQAGLNLDGVVFRVTGSVGVARVMPEHSTPEQVLQDCDIAMYRAKGSGRNRVALCDAAARSEAREALTLVTDLRQALADEALSVVYQPVVSIADPDELSAVEALVRWHHPERGWVEPEQMVRAAEENGLIDVLGVHVLREACRQMASWAARLGERAPGKVNVNLSAIQLMDPRVVDVVRSVLAETGLAPSLLCLEITESALMAEPGACRERLLRLKEIGVRIAVDDFGTGYSSLAYLRQLPVDFLKVDRSFVQELREGHPEVTTAVVGLAHSLGLEAIAEGVEHADQAAQLQALGCRMGQGWLYARPMTSDQLVAWRSGADPAPAPAPAPAPDPAPDPQNTEDVVHP